MAGILLYGLVAGIVLFNLGVGALPLGKLPAAYWLLLIVPIGLIAWTLTTRIRSIEGCGGLVAVLQVLIAGGLLLWAALSYSQESGLNGTTIFIGLMGLWLLILGIRSTIFTFSR